MDAEPSPQQGKNTIAPSLSFWLLNGEFVIISETSCTTPHIFKYTLITTSHLYHHHRQTETECNHIWANELAEFNVSIHHGPGKQNVISVTLSRQSANIYVECMKQCTKVISSDQVKAIIDAADSQHQQSDISLVYLNIVMVAWRTTKDRRQPNNTKKLFQHRWFEKRDSNLNIGYYE